MKSGKNTTVRFRRKRTGQTDYRRRLKLLKSGLLRLVVRRTNKYVIAQIVEYNPDGDKILFAVNSKSLVKLGFEKAGKSLPSSYLTGLLLAKKANDLEAVLDLGLFKSMAGSRLYAVVKGAIDGGLNLKVADSMFPADDRLNGSHISEDVSKVFDKVKSDILKL